MTDPTPPAVSRDEWRLGGHGWNLARRDSTTGQWETIGTASEDWVPVDPSEVESWTPLVPAVSPVDTAALREQLGPKIRAHLNAPHTGIVAKAQDTLFEGIIRLIAEREAGLRADLDRARAERDALSRMLRGMARRLGWMRSDCGDNLDAALGYKRERDDARDDLARVFGARTIPDDAAERLRKLAEEFRSLSDQSVVDALAGEPAEDECDSPAECHGAAACWAWKLAAHHVEKLAAGLSAPTTDPAPALATPLGVGALVRVDHDLLSHPAGDVGLVIGQAKNGPNRYSVLFPGDSCPFSLAAKDLAVVRGLTPQSWWKKRADPAPAAADGHEDVQWGVRRNDGVLDQMDDEEDARRHLNWFDKGTAEVVSRTVLYGPWTWKPTPAEPQAPVVVASHPLTEHCRLCTWDEAPVDTATERQHLADQGAPQSPAEPSATPDGRCAFCIAGSGHYCSCPPEPADDPIVPAPGFGVTNRDYIPASDVADYEAEEARIAAESAAGEDTATPAPTEHTVDIEPLPAFKDWWVATCTAAECGIAEHGPRRHVEDWADSHRADTLQPGPLTPITTEEPNRG